MTGPDAFETPEPSATRRRRSAPVLIEDGDPALAGPAPSPAEAPPPPETGEPTPAVARAARLAAQPRGGWIGRLFWAAAGGFVGLAASVAAWEFVARLLASYPLLGWLAAALLAAAATALLALTIREAAGLARLRRVDGLRAQAERALRADDAVAARIAADGIDRLYGARADLEWARGRVRERRDEVVDADAVIALSEREYLTALDAEARAVVESSARQVAAATALMPVAAVDVIAALGLNLRMIRRIAEIYGGRAGMLGSWRLLRAVAAHLIATGAVAVGDDLLGPVLGGGALAKLSRRFGEGLVNGALTARVGVAAMEVCRPLPFRSLPRPRARSLIARALRGFVPGA